VHILIRGWVCNLLVQLLLGPTRTVTVGSKSCRTHDQILLSHSRLHQPRGPGLSIYILQEQGAPVIPPGTESLFVASCDLQGDVGGILTRQSQSQSQSYLRPTFSRIVCPGIWPPSGPVKNFSFSLKFSSDSCGFVILWRPLQREVGSVIYCCCWASPAQFLSGLSPAELKTIFYWGQVPLFISSRNRVAQVYPRLGFLFVRLTTRRATVEIF
jgi:hypothetical protein